MEKIDIHNYEAFLLDFSEGNLVDETQLELELFLIQHPHLNVELDAIPTVKLINEAVYYKEKSTLKKLSSDLISQNQFIAYIENELSEKEKIDLEKSCALNIDLAKELALYSKTISVANTSIIYLNKNDLKRKSKVIGFNFSAKQFAAAASIILILAIYVLLPNKQVNQNNGTNLAQNKTSKQTINKNTVSNLLSTNLDNTVATKPLAHTKVMVAAAQQQKSKKINNKINLVSAQPKINDAIIKDSSSILTSANLNTNLELPHKEKLMVVKPKTVVEVITENDDELILAENNPSKKRFWSKAGKILKNLNTVGLKSVNGTENTTSESTSYALSIGKVNIVHKDGL